MTATSIRISRVIAVLFAFANGITSLTGVVVIWFGGRLVREGSLQVGDLLPSLFLSSSVLTYLVLGVFVFILMPRAAASAERIQAVLGSAPGTTDPPCPVRPVAVTGAVGVPPGHLRLRGRRA